MIQIYYKEIKLYEERDDVTLTAYIQDVMELSDEKIKRPAILICPGGAYLKCASQEAEPVALRFAAMGYHAFVLRYSTYFGLETNIQVPNSTEDITIKNHCLFPNPVLEIGRSILHIKEYAEKWQIDSDRIALCGFSAGAHNVAMYSNLWNTEIFSKNFNMDLKIFKPTAVILGYMAGDLYFSKIQHKEKDKEILFRTSYMALLGKQELSTEDIKLVSPSLHVNSDNPPTFLWSTSEDGLVSVRNTIKMADALAEKQIPFEMHIFEEGSHGLSLGTQASAKVKKQINKDVAKWVELAEPWLQKRIKIEFLE